MKASHLLFAAMLPVMVTSCRIKDDGKKEEPLTTAEAKDALEEASISAEAANVMGGSIEIATDFTIGGAVEQAAQEIKSFVGSQLPCAEITLAGSTLTIEYGVNPGNCTYHGQTFTGSHSITVSKNADDDVLVQHAWDDLSNGHVSVSGTADVTWSLVQQSRHVVHELTWTRLSDGRTGVGSGDRLQTALDGDITVGFQEDGSRSWDGQAGRWDLAIEGVEMRWIDPVPQAGTYRLATPKNKSVSMSFSRVDEDTIKVTVESGGSSFSFDVSKLGISGG